MIETFIHRVVLEVVDIHWKVQASPSEVTTLKFLNGHMAFTFECQANRRVKKCEYAIVKVEAKGPSVV